jgi:hypothetical protein
MGIRYFATFADGTQREVETDEDGFVNPPMEAVFIEARETREYQTMRWHKPGFNLIVDMGKK